MSVYSIPMYIHALSLIYTGFNIQRYFYTALFRLKSHHADRMAIWMPQKTVELS